MNLLRTRRHRLTLPIAALLFVLQALGSGMVDLAHAADPAAGPVAVETGHTAHCAVLHDALKCALCQYAGTRVALRPIRFEAVGERQPVVRAPLERSAAAPERQILHAPPRAPPASLA